jgi:hypothetical protein
MFVCWYTARSATDGAFSRVFVHSERVLQPFASTWDILECEELPNHKEKLDWSESAGICHLYPTTYSSFRNCFLCKLQSVTVSNAMIQSAIYLNHTK